MSIRPMTTDEIRAALRHGAQVCIERDISNWACYDVTRKDGAFYAALRWAGGDNNWTDYPPEHAAMFLLLVAEAVE